MKKIGITVQFPDGDISILTNQINLFKKAKINSLEISIYETDVIVGKKINFPELKILKEAVANTDMAYTVHGELSVNLLDQENFEDHKEVLKRSEALNIAPYAGFMNPKYKIITDTNGEISDIQITYPDNFVDQMLHYDESYSFLPSMNN